VMRKYRLDQKVAGQGLVEFTLILPILLLALMGIIEFSRLLATYIGVNSASREAARYGAGVGLTNRATLTPPYQDCDGIRAAAERTTALAALDDVVIEYDNLNDGTTALCPPSRSDVILGSRIIVTVTASFQPIVPLANLQSLTIVSTSRRTILKEVWITASW